jgi:hypothetical protein
VTYHLDAAGVWIETDQILGDRLWGEVPMPAPRRLAYALVVCLLVAGCGGGGPDGGGGLAGQPASQDAAVQAGGQDAAGQPGGQDGGAQSGGATGSPVGEGGGGVALGAPIQIPAITQAQGLPLDEVQPRLEAAIRAKCGGELCVKLKVEARDEPNFTACQFVTTEPPPGSRVERGTTVVVVTGQEPCTTDTTETTDTSQGGSPGDAQPTGEGGTTQSTESQATTSS